MLCADVDALTVQHWYTGEGMDEMEFTEAESNMHDLVHPSVLLLLTNRSRNTNNTKMPRLTKRKSTKMSSLLRKANKKVQQEKFRVRQRV